MRYGLPRRARVALPLTASLLLLAGCDAANDTESEAEAEPSPVETAAPEFTDADGEKPNIVILDGGGTIVSTAEGPADYTHYGDESLDGIQDVLDRISPEIDEVANLEVVDGAIPGVSSTTTVEQLFEMTRQLNGIMADDEVDSVVVNTGTTIMEEISYWADLTVRSDKLLVFTGSMRQANTFSFDGEANLFNAIRVAASGETRCFGAVQLLNDEFVAAREVTKTDAWRTDTFSGGRYGALGTVDGDNVRTVRAPARVLDRGTEEWTTPFDLSTVDVDDLAQVEIAYSYVEADATPIEALAEAGVDGIVTAGHGAGGISAAQSEAREAAIADDGVLFASTTRTGSGSIYDDGTKGVLPGYDLTPQKARVLLQLAVTFSDDEDQIRDWFTTIGAPEFNGAP